MSIDLAVMLGNVMTAFIAGNRRPAMMANIGVTEYLTQIASVRAKAATIAAEQLGFNVPPQQIKHLTDTLMFEYLKLTTRLAGLPTHKTDIGQDTLRQLASWSKVFVRAPGLGYAREYVKPAAGDGMASDGLTVATPYTHWHKQLLEGLIVVDRGRFTVDLVPSTTDQGSTDKRDIIPGMVRSVIDQVFGVMAWFTMYDWQPLWLPFFVNRRVLELALKIARAIGTSRDAIMLDGLEDNLKWIWNQTLHPHYTYIASCLMTGTVDTKHGTRDLHYRWGSRQESSLKDETDARVRATELAMMMIRIARFDAFTDPMGDDSFVWGDENAIKSAAEPSDDGLKGVGLSPGQLRRLYNSIGPITAKWPDVHNKLGWNRLSGNIDQVEMRGGDFILTDGIQYSGSTASALLGIRPVLSLGNVQFAGLGRRHDDKFNVRKGQEIKFSVMTVNGHIGMTRTGNIVERNFMPRGMWMGEVDVEQKMSGNLVDDEIGELVVAHFSAQTTNECYVSTAYAPAVPVAGGVLNVTDWDAFASDADKAKTDIAFAAGYVKDMESAMTGMYYWRSTFNIRFPVAMSRAEHGVEHYDLLGSYVGVLPYDGHIDYDDEASLTATPTDVQAIVDSINIVGPSRVQPDVAEAKVESGS